MTNAAEPKAANPKGLSPVVKGLLAFVLIAFVSVLFWLGQNWMGQADPDAPIVEVEIPKGASVRMAANRLEQAGVVSDARAFELLARTLGGTRDVQFGVYGMPKGDGWRAILERMQRGDTLTVRFTVPEGMPSILVAERLNALPRLKGEAPVPPEGSVLPATYEIKVGDSRAEALRRMQDAMTKELDRLWEKRAAHSVVKTKEEAVILASVVEKESGVPSERGKIAGLYSNRLRIGMPLQADPTVIYPVTKGKPLGRRILRSELNADNGYNTYRRAGLPVGPITNPGRESLAAVLNPDKHDDLFMVADGSGGHVFARTYADHQANVAKWRAYRNEKGI